MCNTLQNIPDSMDWKEDVIQLQRHKVVSLLMELLNCCYPEQHEYLLLRAEKYESLCYTRASSIQHYYELANEGVLKIRDAYDTQLAGAGRPGSAKRKGKQIKSIGLDMSSSADTTAEGVTPTVDSVVTSVVKSLEEMGNQAACNTANPTANPVPNPVVLANPLNLIDEVNPILNQTDALDLQNNPVTRDVNQTQANIESFMVNPASTMSPSLPLIPQLEQLETPTLNHMSNTAAPSTGNNPVTSICTPMENHAIKSAIGPSFNQVAFEVSPNQISNGIINPTINHHLKQMPNQMINQITNRGQSSERNPALNAQMGTPSFKPTRVIPSERDLLTAPILSTGNQPQMLQRHSEEVNQVFLPEGMIPTGMITGVPTGVSNLKENPMVNSNQAKENEQAPISIVGNVSFQPTSAIGAPLGRASSCRRQKNSINSRSMETRSQAKAFQRSGSKKRNSSTAGINTQISPPAPAQRGQRQTAPRQVYSSAHFDTAATSDQKVSLKAAPHIQPQSDSQRGQILFLDPTMNERIFIADGIYVSLAQVHTVAASCGYRLTPETIKSLSKEQVLRLFLRSRQLSLTKAYDFLCAANGQTFASMPHLDSLGVEYQIVDYEGKHIGNATANVNGVQSSNSGIARHASVPANVKLNRSDTTAQARISQPSAPQKHGSNRSTSLHQDSRPLQESSTRDTVQELPNHPGSRQAARANVASRITSTSRGPSSIMQGTGNMRALSWEGTASPAFAVSSSGAIADPEQPIANLPSTSQNLSTSAATKVENATSVKDHHSTQQSPADIGAFRNYAATLSSRVARFQKKYAPYKGLINQTLTFLLRTGSQGQMQVVYLQYCMQLLNQPNAMGPELNMDVLNTTETFLRDFLVRFQGIPMKAKPGPSNS